MGDVDDAGNSLLLDGVGPRVVLAFEGLAADRPSAFPRSGTPVSGPAAKPRVASSWERSQSDRMPGRNEYSFLGRGRCGCPSAAVPKRDRISESRDCKVRVDHGCAGSIAVHSVSALRPGRR